MEISDLIKQIVKDQEENYSKVATITEIDEEERTCTVSLNDGGADIFDVRLQSVISGLIGLVIFPKIGSEVIITFLNKNVAYIALYGEIEKIFLKIGDMEVFVDASNVNVSVENVDVISENTEISSNHVKINSPDVQVQANTVKTVCTSFEIQGANIKIDAPLVDIIAGAMNISGAVALNGSFALSGSMTLNGGGNGGVPMSTPLVTKMNKIETLLNQLKQRFNSWTVVPEDGGAALKSQLNGWHTVPITPTTPNEISNPQITQ